ncbi:TRAP transporter small permease [Thalassospira lucentensis]|uniref:TRAP transporter small permease n=1 Tax=Thalassospira lucentensis TaxID=168935 RepID=UPI00142DE607|nr:TRAP transporter small permease [Thalassospira lucentensis]NIZ01014.1 TRAP transporter small permease [Thalassospira lucentensis]
MSDINRDLFTEQEQEDLAATSSFKLTLADIPALIIFAALFATVFLQFFTRYVLNDSVAWTEEIARYLLILLAFVGAIKCQLVDSHIRLEFIDKLAGRKLPILKILSLILSAGFFGFAIYSLNELMTKTAYQKMVSLPVPKYYFYGLIMAALVALVAVHIRQIYVLLRGKK